MTNPIGWCDRTWNPITGCSPVSPACDHCYAERMSKRLAGRFGYPAGASHSASSCAAWATSFIPAFLTSGWTVCSQ
jgi:protein gp37